jgi:hypothetical protein
MASQSSATQKYIHGCIVKTPSEYKQSIQQAWQRRISSQIDTTD